MKKTLSMIVGGTLLASGILSCEGPRFPGPERGDFIEIIDVEYKSKDLESQDPTEHLPYLIVDHWGRDKDGIKSIEFYVNDVLIHEDKDPIPHIASPSYWTFEFPNIGDSEDKILLNNNLELEEGKYVFRAVLIDKEGNSVEDITTFKVKK